MVEEGERREGGRGREGGGGGREMEREKEEKKKADKFTHYTAYDPIDYASHSSIVPLKVCMG